MANAQDIPFLFAKLENWLLKPLKKEIRKTKKENHFRFFVLLSVVIDNLANIRYLGEIPGINKGGERFKKFVEIYMPRYNKNDLYYNFRCKLVHAFQIEGFDLQQKPHTRRLHLKKFPNGVVCLNSSEFLKDVLKAHKKLKSEMVGRHADKAILESFKNSSYKPWLHFDDVETFNQAPKNKVVLEPIAE